MSPTYTDWTETQFDRKSPMPFGGEGCEPPGSDATALDANGRSPMPFGGEGCEPCAPILVNTGAGSRGVQVWAQFFGIPAGRQAGVLAG